MIEPKAVFYVCDCETCDFCHKKKGRMLEFWQKAFDGMNFNQDLHICGDCLEKAYARFHNKELVE